MKSSNPQRLFLLFFVLCSLTFVTISVDAELFVLHKEDTSTTNGWKIESGSGSLSNVGTRIRLTGTSGSIFATKQSQFFFNQPLNETLLSYLGATHVMTNFTGEPGEAQQGGESQTVFVRSSLFDSESTFLDFDGGGNLQSGCGGTTVTMSSTQIR